MAECIAQARNGHISTSGLKHDVNVVFPEPRFPIGRENFCNLRTFCKADIGLVHICMDFQDLLA